MPSLLHESLIALFRNRPTLAPEVLAEALSVEVPTYTEATIESAELNEITPTEYRADLVILLHEGTPVLAIVVEVQLDRDSDKRWVWPAYLATLRERMRCPSGLLVVCPDEAIATWCRQPIPLGPGGFELRPIVLGPDAVPVVTDEFTAVATPELAVLSVMAHGQGEHAVEIGRAALGAAAPLDEDRALFYNDLIWAALSEAARRALEALMQPEGYQYQSDFAKKYFGQGEAKGVARSVLTVLSTRGFEISDEARQKIFDCQDLEQLVEWTRRAVTADNLDDVFK